MKEAGGCLLYGAIEANKSWIDGSIPGSGLREFRRSGETKDEEDGGEGELAVEDMNSRMEGRIRGLLFRDFRWGGETDDDDEGRA